MADEEQLTRELDHYKEDIDRLNKRWKSIFEIFGMYEHENYFRAIVSKPMSNDLLNDHRNINEFAKLNGVEIINILPAGFKSPIFNSISWDELKLSL